MALKFYKALFSLLDKDQELMQELIIVDPVKSCGNILQSLKNRLQQPNMLHSACLELINTFGVSIHKHLGSDFHNQIKGTYLELKEIPEHLLEKFYEPIKPPKPKMTKQQA